MNCKFSTIVDSIMNLLVSIRVLAMCSGGGGRQNQKKSAPKPLV